jgi:hypothetical protein
VMTSSDPRRHWWNVVLPSPDGVTHTTFTEFRGAVTEILSLAFLVSKAHVIAVMAETIREAAAIVRRPMQDIETAVVGTIRVSPSH